MLTNTRKSIFGQVYAKPKIANVQLPMHGQSNLKPILTTTLLLIQAKMVMSKQNVRRWVIMPKIVMEKLGFGDLVESD